MTNAQLISETTAPIKPRAIIARITDFVLAFAVGAVVLAFILAAFGLVCRLIYTAWHFGWSAF